jgi:hypothetical protein
MEAPLDVGISVREFGFEWELNYPFLLLYTITQRLHQHILRPRNANCCAVGN